MVEKSKCTGCTACAAVCPTQCILMKKDEEGFLYPLVSQIQCIHCGKCDSVCPAIKQPEYPVIPIYAIGAFTKNEEVRKKSSSGGVFYELASRILEKRGIVYGAAFDQQIRTVTHRFITRREEISKLMGSKYIQSNLSDTYAQVKKQLDTGTEVLFSGTPCQIYGLRNFLNKEYENLICVSVICHGAPSPRLWEKYLKMRTDQLGGPVRDCNFRDKKKGWNHFGLKLSSVTGKSKYISAQTDPFMRMFLKNMSLRPSCYSCCAKNNSCRADIVLGDFWGVQYRVPELADDKGTSLVLVYSKKGDVLIKKISNALVLQRVDSEEALMGNRAFSNSVLKPVNRNDLFADIEKMDFKLLSEKYVPVTIKDRIKIMLDSVNLLESVWKIMNKQK